MCWTRAPAAPRAGVPVVLERQAGDGWQSLGQGVTNQDGRIGDLLGHSKLATATYRLTFDTAAYFSAKKQSSFYPQVQVVFTATAAAIYLARHVHDKDQIRHTIESQFGYDLTARLEQIRPRYGFDETCQGTVPQALAAFFESTSYEDAVRNAISLGGDADTLACITGGIAKAYYGGTPQDLVAPVMARLDERLVAVVDRFRERFDLV